MMREAIETGATVDIALDNACKALGVDRDGVKFEIVQMPSAKTLGIFGGNPAKVRVYLEDGPLDAAESYLKKVLAAMGAEDFTMESKEVEGGAVIQIDGDDAGYIIGHRGETLDSLQYLVSLVANRGKSEYYRVQLNSGNYREKREQSLEGLAKKVAIGAVKTGRVSHLEPMNPYERRIIHSAVQEIKGATSWSTGQNRDRHVVIGPENKMGDKSRSFGAKSESRPTRPEPEKETKNEAQDSPLYGRIN